MSKFAIFGASGQCGGATIANLLQHQKNPRRGEDFEIHAFVRDKDSDTAKTLKKKGVTIVECDFTDKKAVAKKLAGMTSVFSMQPSGLSFDDEVAAGQNIISAANTAGVKHLVYLSSAGADEKGAEAVDILAPKAALEDFLRAECGSKSHSSLLDEEDGDSKKGGKGGKSSKKDGKKAAGKKAAAPKKRKGGNMIFTILRPALFVDNLWGPYAKSTLKMAGACGNKKISWVSTRDVGAFAAHALLRRDECKNRAFNIAGENASFPEVIATMKKNGLSTSTGWFTSSNDAFANFLAAHSGDIRVSKCAELVPDLQTVAQAIEFHKKNEGNRFSVVARGASKGKKNLKDAARGVSKRASKIAGGSKKSKKGGDDDDDEANDDAGGDSDNEDGGKGKKAAAKGSKKAAAKGSKKAAAKGSKKAAAKGSKKEAAKGSKKDSKKDSKKGAKGSKKGGKK